MIDRQGTKIFIECDFRAQRFLRARTRGRIRGDVVARHRRLDRAQDRRGLGAWLPAVRSMTDVLALDIATTTGMARGRVDSTPFADSIAFAKHAGANNDAVFARALEWLSTYLKDDKPDVVFIEAMLPPDAMKNATSRAVRDRLAGLHGVIRAVCYLRGIYRIEAVSVGDIRGHFLGRRSLKRDAAKARSRRALPRPGWHCVNDNEGDALAFGRMLARRSTVTPHGFPRFLTARCGFPDAHAATRVHRSRRGSRYSFGAGEYPDMNAAIAELLDAAFRDGLIERYGEAYLMRIPDRLFTPYLESSHGAV